MARLATNLGRSLGLLAAGCVLLLGTACTTPDYYYSVNGEPIVFPIDASTLRDRHAIGVETQVSSLGLPSAAARQAGPKNRAASAFGPRSSRATPCTTPRSPRAKVAWVNFDLVTANPMWNQKFDKATEQLYSQNWIGANQVRSLSDG